MTTIRTRRALRSPGRPRGPGRPQGSVAGQRDRLLEAALAHYARHGIAGANLRAIAAAAEVTPALIGYYFGGKDALLEAVVEERLLPVVGGLRAPLAGAGEDVAALAGAFVRGVHATVRQHPWLPSLWVREILTEGGALRGLLIRRVAPQVPQALAARFAAARRRGAIDRRLDPRLLVVSLIGLTLFPLAAESIWRELFDAGDVDDAALQAHTLALLQRALETDDAP